MNLPPSGWLKCNIDGASRGNPGAIPIKFCVRDSSCDFVGARGLRIYETTNILVVAMALRKEVNIDL